MQVALGAKISIFLKKLLPFNDNENFLFFVGCIFLLLKSGSLILIYLHKETQAAHLEKRFSDICMSSLLEIGIGDVR